MIQRIQSVYLLLGALALGALFFFDETIWQSAAAQAQGWFAPVLMVLCGVTGAAAVVAIFLYKDRARQRAVVLGVQMLTVLIVLVLFGGFYLSGGLNVVVDDAVNVAKLVALLLPVVAYVLFYLARRGIESDIRLVRSMDRLR